MTVPDFPFKLLMLVATLLYGTDAASSTSLCHNFSFQGQCIQRSDCLCLCYFVKQDRLYLEAAYFGELGYELQIYTPYVYYVHQLGLLHRTIGPIGSAPYLYFSTNHTEVPFSRHDCTFHGTWAHPSPHQMPFNYDEWQPPPYKDHYNSELTFDKPMIIIHNKHAVEWGHAPVNFIDIPTLLELATLLKPEYTIVYIRPHGNIQGYAADHNAPTSFEDHESLQKAHPEVILFNDLLQQHPGYSFNELQLLLHAKCERFISVLGGNAVIASYFAGTNVIYAVEGTELKSRLEFQHYRNFSTSPPQSRIHQVGNYSELL